MIQFLIQDLKNNNRNFDKIFINIVAGAAEFIEFARSPAFFVPKTSDTLNCLTRLRIIGKKCIINLLYCLFYAQ